MTTYTISSHSDARMSSLDGETYETLEAAEADLRRVGPTDLVLVECDGGSTLVYADQEDADADADGAAPHKAIARIEEVQS